MRVGAWDYCRVINTRDSKALSGGGQRRWEVSSFPVVWDRSSQVVDPPCTEAAAQSLCTPSAEAPVSHSLFPAWPSLPGRWLLHLCWLLHMQRVRMHLLQEVSVGASLAIWGLWPRQGRAPRAGSQSVVLGSWPSFTHRSHHCLLKLSAPAWDPMRRGHLFLCGPNLGGSTRVAVGQHVLLH